MATGKRRVANPIAVRRYTVEGQPSREVVLTLGKPRPDPRPGGGFSCTVLIQGTPHERRRRIYGEDALQALQLAMFYARRALDRSGLTLVWLDEPGDTGLPLSAPSGFGFDFQRRVERLMRREELRFARAVTAAAKAAARRRAREP